MLGELEALLRFPERGKQRSDVAMRVSRRMHIDPVIGDRVAGAKADDDVRCARLVVDPDDLDRCGLLQASPVVAP